MIGKLHDYKMVAALYRAGASYAQISKATGIPQGSIGYAVRGQNVPLKRQAGEVSPIDANGYHSPVYSADTINKICSLRGTKSASAIANELGLASRCVVIGIWNRALQKQRGGAHG